MTDELKSYKLVPKFNPIFKRWEVQDPRNAALSIEVDVQQAIDAALENALYEIEEYTNIYLRAIERLCGFIGHNPLAERDARIAELESLLAEAYADADDVLRPAFAELHDACHAKQECIDSLKTERDELVRERDEARKDAERLDYLQDNQLSLYVKSTRDCVGWCVGNRVIESSSARSAIDAAMLAEREKE